MDPGPVVAVLERVVARARGDPGGVRIPVRRNCVTRMAVGRLQAMRHVPAHRWLSALRLLVLGMIALGLMLQPVFAAAGEAHALSHGSSGGHAHKPGNGVMGAASSVAGDQDDADAGALHVMLHYAHCCGATAALLPAPRPVFVASADRLSAQAETSLPPQPRLTSPFKPPICG